MVIELKTLGATLSNQRVTDKIVVTAEGCSLQGLTIENGPGRGIELQGAHYCIIRDCTILGVGADQAATPANDLIYAMNSHAVTLRRSTLKDAGRTHILARNCDDWLVESNTFDTNESTTDQHSESMSLGGDAPTTNRWSIRHNTFKGCTGTGVIVFCGSDFLVEKNLILHDVPIRLGNGSITGWTGNLVSNSLFIHNTIVDEHEEGDLYLMGIRFPTSAGNTAYHNLFITKDGDGTLLSVAGPHVFCNVETTGGNVFIGSFGNKSRFGIAPQRFSYTDGLFAPDYTPLVPLPVDPSLPSYGWTTVGCREYNIPIPEPTPPPVPVPLHTIPAGTQIRVALVDDLPIY